MSQGLCILLSVTLFAPSGTIFWWTQSAVSVALMLHTPDRFWYEKIIHVFSGLAAYVFIRRNAFPMNLLLTVCASNASGQIVGYATMKHSFKRLDSHHVTDLKFLAVFTIGPVTFASLVAAVPGSLGFYFLLGNVKLFNVFVNYFFGHVSGTATILYPSLVIPALWQQKTKIAWRQLLGLPCIVILCLFKSYFLFGFTTIVLIYGIVIWTSIYTDQFFSSIIGFLSTSVVLGSTIAKRGPFNHLGEGDETDSVVIGTQMAITVLTLVSASIVMIFTRMRDTELSERKLREKMKEKIDNQVVNLFRIGHDLGNNATLVKGLCENIQNGGCSADFSMKIVDAINTLNGVLISDMVDSIKCDEDKILSKERVNIAEIIETYIIVATGMSTLARKDIMVTSSGVEDGNIVVFTNRERLHQIMCNVVGNAVKYTKRGRIDFVVSYSNDDLSIHVADTGIGIDEKDLDRVFDTFYRCDRATQINSGSGVGLSNVKKICNLIGAKIHVCSEGEGLGSTFTLSLKRASSVETIQQFTFLVLVLDDSFVIRKLLASYITSLGCEVICFGSVNEARKELLDTTCPPFDVIFTDHSMEGQSGKDFICDIRAGTLKGVRIDTPCVICSGEIHDIMDDRTFFMGKPFSKADVSGCLDRVARVTSDMAHL